MRKNRKLGRLSLANGGMSKLKAASSGPILMLFMTYTVSACSYLILKLPAAAGTWMHRQSEHVMTFLLAEMGASGCLDGHQRLVVKGRFAPKNFEEILRLNIRVQ